MRLLYRKSIENEFARILGVPVLFSPIARYLWAAAVTFIILCGFAGWIGGAQ